MFDTDELVAECQAAVGETDPRRSVKEVLERVVARPGELAEVLDPSEGGLQLLHVSSDLTVLHVVWAPHMQLFPHDHRMWAAIGIYAGREDNGFYRRTDDQGGRIVESGGKQLDEGDVILLGDDTIHSVSNPLDRLTAAIHVYGGDFVNQPRSQWGPGDPVERPYDMESVSRQFAEANAAWRTTAG